MDRRALLTAGIAGVAGIAVGNELGAQPAGAAADVDRTEFEALKARVAYLETLHPPMPTTTTTTTTTVPPHVPKFSGNVSLPDGFVVPFGEVWDFDPAASTTVTVSKNVVVAGTLEMRPADPGVVHTLRFTNVDESQFVGGGMDPLDTDVGMWVVGAGKLDLAGAAKTAWSRAAAAIAAGSNDVTLSAAPTGWQVGDTVVIAPTAAPTSSTFATQYDTLTVQAINGATITLSGPCTYAHPLVTVGPGMTLGAEVMNLTRNVCIEGTATGRAHGWITSSVAQTVDYVQLRYMGPRKATGRVTYYGPVTAAVLGRYPLHFHMCGDGSTGSSVKGSVAWQSGARGFVPHESNGVTFDACIAHDVMDEPFWWDGAPNPSTPSSESDDVVWRRCVASLVKVDPAFEGYRLAGFVLGSGARNICEDCVAVGVQGNITAAGFIWPESGNTDWATTRLVSHNNSCNGFFAWQNSGTFEVHDFALFHNGVAGINHGAYVNNYRYGNGYLFANKTAAIVLHAMSEAGPDPLRFEALRCDGNGIAANAVALPFHSGTAQQPVRFAGCDLIGHSGSTVKVTASQVTKPEIIDFVECGPVAVEWNSYSPATSVIRWQNAGTAQQITTAGAMAIGPWSTAVPTRVQPFTLLAAA